MVFLVLLANEFKSRLKSRLSTILLVKGKAPGQSSCKSGQLTGEGGWRTEREEPHLNDASREASRMVASDHMAGRGNSEKVEKLRAPEKVHLGTGWHLKGKDRREENGKCLVSESGLRETGTSK